MKSRLMLATPSVMLLTLVIILSTGCAKVIQHQETCNSRAYLQENLSDYISKRFSSEAQVRLAIIPFSVPANLTGYSSELPHLGNQIAWRVHSSMLAAQQIPIVEVLNRDWPGKKEEFFRGNFGAIAQARQAGYDLVLVGLVEPLKAVDRMTIYSKLIDVSSGITTYYGKTQASMKKNDEQPAIFSAFWNSNRRPDLLFTDAIVDAASECIVSEIAKN